MKVKPSLVHIIWEGDGYIDSKAFIHQSANEREAFPPQMLIPVQNRYPIEDVATINHKGQNKDPQGVKGTQE